MKSGLTLTQMAQEIERQNAAKRDFIADSRKLSFSHDMETITMKNGGMEPLGVFPVNTHAHRQTAEHLDVPTKFYDSLRTRHPDLLATTVNALFEREPERRMVRVLDGRIRALLSDRFRPLDNFDLANAVLPVLSDAPEMRIESTQFTEARFYIKAVFPRIQSQVRVGDVVQAGIVISNSEIGAGSVSVLPLIYRLLCSNGLIAPESGQRRYHTGKRIGGAEGEAFEMFSDRTRQLDDAAFWAKVQDIVRGVMNQEIFEGIVDKLREATGDRISASIADVIEVTSKHFGYNKKTSDGILSHLAAGGDLTRYGLINAITRQSQDEEDYELATRLEADGGAILELPRSDWREIAEST